MHGYQRKRGQDWIRTLKGVSFSTTQKGLIGIDYRTHKIVVSLDIVFNKGSFQGTKEKQDDDAILPIELSELSDEAS